MELCSLAFLAGVLLVQQQAELPSLLWTLFLPPALALGLWKPRLLPLAFLIAGFSWTVLRAGGVLGDALDPALEGRDLAVVGRVADIPRPAERGLRFEFEIEAARDAGRPVAAPRRVLLATYDRALQPAVAERWALTVRLKRPHGMQNPGGFDYEAWLFQHRLRATGYVRAHPSPQRIAAETASFSLDRLRQRLSERLRGLLPGDPFAGLIVAFANGDENGVGDNQWRVLQRTGTIHLVAISGMNIGLVAGFVFLLVRRAWTLRPRAALLFPAPKAAALAALAAGTFYAALAGFAIPTQRALAMLAVVLAGVLFGRRLAPFQLLSLALLAVLLLDPLATLAAGFWLSFAAVALIVYTIQGRRRTRDWRERFGAWADVQWAVAVGLVPLTLVFFQQASLSGPLANLLAIPMIELIVIPATLVGVLGAALPDAAAQIPLRIAALALAALWPVLEWLAALDHTLWVQHTPRPWTLAAALVGIAWLLAPRGFPARWVGAAWMLPLALARPPAPAPGELWFTLLDVGQGLAAVARTAHHTLVYDTGPRWSGRFDAGRAVVAPFLREGAVGRIDMLVVSHGDADHIGGAASLRESLPVARLLSSVPERLPGAESCRVGERWEWDDVRFTLLHPPADRPGEGNRASCVLLIESAYGRVLLPGDIPAAIEHGLVADRPGALRAEVLLVPHHGSKSSSSARFLAAVAPQIALVPAGYRNAHRHPHPAVVERYRAAGIALIGTAEHGAITLRLGPPGRDLEGRRHAWRRYWHAPPEAAALSPAARL